MSPSLLLSHFGHSVLQPSSSVSWSATDMGTQQIKCDNNTDEDISPNNNFSLQKFRQSRIIVFAYLSLIMDWNRSRSPLGHYIFGYITLLTEHRSMSEVMIYTWINSFLMGIMLIIIMIAKMDNIYKIQKNIKINDVKELLKL